MIAEMELQEQIKSETEGIKKVIEDTLSIFTIYNNDTSEKWLLSLARKKLSKISRTVHELRMACLTEIKKGKTKDNAK